MSSVLFTNYNAQQVKDYLNGKHEQYPPTNSPQRGALTPLLPLKQHLRALGAH
jgi:hypothetical protein